MHTDDDFASENRGRLLRTLQRDEREPRGPGAVVILVLMIVAGAVFVVAIVARDEDPVAAAKPVPVEVVPCR